MKTKTMSSKDIGCSSEVASLNDCRRQEGQWDQEGASAGQRRDSDPAKVERTRHSEGTIITPVSSSS